MENNNTKVDYTLPEWHCPVYGKVVPNWLCLETEAALTKQLKKSAVPEMSEVVDIALAEKQCFNCPYSK